MGSGPKCSPAIMSHTSFEKRAATDDRVSDLRGGRRPDRHRTGGRIIMPDGSSAPAPPTLEGCGFPPQMIVPLRSCRTLHPKREQPMTAYLISLALAGLIEIAIWEFS